MISVVVPVYEVELYLRRCIDSIMNQTYESFELILVDDGSTDGCPQICDEYADKYGNVYVIHKNNGGLSDARNVGTLAARGEYVTYIDSDDYVSPDYLEVLWRLKKKYQAELTVTGIVAFVEGSNPPKAKKKEFTCSGTKALQNVLYQKYMDTSACGMLIPIQVARKNLFPVGKYHEDEFTTYKFYENVNCVAVTTQKQYFYLQRKDSIMHQKFGKASLDELDAADNLVQICEKRHPELVRAAKAKKFSDYCQVLLNAWNLQETNPDIYTRITNYLKEVRFEIFKDRRTRFKNKIAAFLLFFGIQVLLFANQFRKSES